MMLRKINLALGAIAGVGLLFVGGVILWTMLSSPENSTITQLIGR